MITHDHVTETRPHHFATEASDLGLRPGEWPPSIPTAIGNGQPFLRGTVHRDADNDIIKVDYAQALGCITLTIFND